MRTLDKSRKSSNQANPDSDSLSSKSLNQANPDSNTFTRTPKLRFKGENSNAFPAWIEKSLGSVGSTFNGLSGKTKENFGEGAPYIQYMQIFANSRIDISKCGLVQIEINENQQRVKYGDIFFTTSSETPNEIGTCSVLLDDMPELYLNSFCFGFRPYSLEQLSPEFAQFLLRNPIFRKRIIKLAQGSTRYNMSKVELMKLHVHLPSLPEQQKIASFLSAVDEKIQQLTRKKEALERYKKGVMQQLFSGKLRFKDENGKAFPKWEKKRLGDVAERVVRKNKENNLNVLTISAQMGLVSQLEYFNKNVAAKDVTKYYLLETDEFAYNKSYSAGYPMGAIKRLIRYNKGVVSTLYICFRFTNDVSLEFMEQYFETGKQNIELEKVAQEGARNHGLLNIAVGDFFQIQILLPTIKEQQKIASYLSGIDTKLERVSSQITEAQTFKKGLLQQLFV